MVAEAGRFGVECALVRRSAAVEDTVPSCRRVSHAVCSFCVDDDAVERVRARLQTAAEGRTDPGAVEAALERARDQIEDLAEAAAELSASLPAQVGESVREGLRREVIPVARNLAEVRGLLNQMIRRLERLEGDMLAERHARVDDLALLVDLITSGWQGVDERLGRIEHRAREPQRRGRLPDGGAARRRRAARLIPPDSSLIGRPFLFSADNAPPSS